jgi:molecular chaperone GrpE (heat shock protein)
MAIWRGAGGSGDATTDAANEASVASNKATEAAASAAAAASSATAAASSATSASGSATSASNSATAAASSASAAASSASSAASSATSAGASLSSAVTAQAAAEAAQVAAETAETNAETAQAAAEAAQAAAELAEANAETAEAGAESAQAAAEAARDAALSALDNFDDRYLGAKASDPTLDNDGNALVAGALYFNTTDDVMKVYEGSIWVAAYASVSGALIAAQNLSDLTNVATARTNLGLGTAATTAATDYATAAQGALADSAVQPADLGTAAYTDSTAYATSAQGALADSATQPGDNISTLTNDAGYITGYTETDPVYLASSWYTTTNNAANWDTAYGWGDHATVGYAFYPSQTGNSGKFLTTDGSNTSWATVDALPSQTGNAGEFLTTDGTTASWAAIATGNTTATGIWENSNTISSNYTITTNYNAMSVGPITVASGVTVEVPSGSTWVII